MPNIDPVLIFGELNPDGSIKRDVKLCAISGKPTEQGDVMMRIPNTNRFYRVKAPFLWPQNAEAFKEQQAAVEAQLVPPSAPAADTPKVGRKVAAADIAPSAPDTKENS